MEKDEVLARLTRLQELIERVLGMMPNRVNASVREGHLHDLSFHKNYSAGSHAAVTMSGAYTYITLSGQDIVRGQINLTTDVTARLPYANIVAATAASLLLGRGSAAGSGDWQEITLGTGLTMTGTVLSSTASGGHTIRENGTDQTARLGLNFVDTGAGAGLITDDAVNNETEVNLSLYVLLSGRGGGTTIYGGNNDTDVLALKGNSGAGNYVSMLDDMRLASSKGIEDSGGTVRMLLATSSPHITLTGDVVITGSGSGSTTGALNFTSTTAPFYGITMTQSLTGGTYTGINITPTLTSNANGSVITGIQGLAQMLINAHTGVNLFGLDFQARASPASGTTLGTVTSLIAVKATSDARITAGTTSTLGVTTQTGIQAILSWNISTILGAGATDTLNITTARGINVVAPSVVTGGSGTEVVATTTLIGIDIDAVALSNASVTVTNAFGLRVGDITGTSFTAANNRVVQFGSATPTTTSGLFEMMANFTAAANATPIWISEGATPTRRQLKTKAGNTLGAGDLVCVLV